MQHCLYLNYAQDVKTSSSYTIFFKINDKTSYYSLDFSVITEHSINWNTTYNWDYRPEKNWLLWENDVIEVFWQPRMHIEDFSAPYYEWQITPHNYSFCLNILRPRESYYCPLKCPIQYKNAIKFNPSTGKRTWNCSFLVPKVLNEGWPNTINAIGAFAILGEPNDRKYFSLKNYKMNKPDFHLPKNFFLLSDLTV